MCGRALTVVLALAGCTHATAPTARHVGEVCAIGGVIGMIAGTVIGPYTGTTGEIMPTFSVISAFGIAAYAVGELSEPPTGPDPETLSEKHTRWAKILTERAGGAAREGNCTRVRRLEKRVNVYDREIHDFVFMRDPEIVRCLEAPVAPPTDAPALPPGVDPRIDSTLGTAPGTDAPAPPAPEPPPAP